MAVPPDFPPETHYRFKYAIYFMYNKNNELLAMGHTRGSQSSLWYNRPWIDEVATIKLVWFDDREECLAALARAALRSSPKHQSRGQLTNRGENTGQPLCPTCHNPKQRRTAAYCHACMRVYQQKRRMDMVRQAHKTEGKLRLAAETKAQVEEFDRLYAIHKDDFPPGHSPSLADLRIAAGLPPS